MRKQFVQTIERIMAEDDRLMVLLGDIGVFGFRNAFKLFPERIYNIGICEQAMTGVAAGLAKEGLIPVLHSIAPFVVERAFEQLKVDLCYQKLSAKIISVGSSYDYAALGCTHHCPGDVAILQFLPEMEIVIPGSASEFDRLFSESYNNGRPTYFRLSERSNRENIDVVFGKVNVIQEGSMATIIAVGPTLTMAIEAVQDIDVTVLYMTTVAPFDAAALKENCPSGKILLVEPYYMGALNYEIQASLGLSQIVIDSLGVPKKFLTDYGSAEQHDAAIGLTAANIRARAQRLINA